MEVKNSETDTFDLAKTHDELMEANNSETDTFDLMELKTSYETDTFDQAKTSDQIVLSEGGLHAENKGGSWYSYST